eukprot:7112371-Pyramimonas_sp.AAC.1
MSPRRSAGLAAAPTASASPPLLPPTVFSWFDWAVSALAAFFGLKSFTCRPHLHFHQSSDVQR